MSGSKHVILFLAPQPFYQERGTPIAVRMAVETLANAHNSTTNPQKTYQITLLTYNEGFDVPIQGVTHIRMWAPKWLIGVRPGISIKKLIADFFFTIAAVRHLLKGNYDSIHAVEESVFIALPFALINKKPIVYDMDSSLASQLLERWKFLSIIKPVITCLEKIAIKKSSGVLAVCDELVNLANTYSNNSVAPLYDVSLLEDQSAPTQEDLRVTISAQPDSKIILYIGNLETYQGVDLLIESMAHLSKNQSEHSDTHCIIIGGNPSQIEKYSNMASNLDVSKHVHLIGPRPLSQLGSYLKQANVLSSPRIKGNNTPMKVYSYLDSEVPVVATKLITHTQAMSESEAFFANPDPHSYAEALHTALCNTELSKSKTECAKKLVANRYTKNAFSKALIGFYQKLISNSRS